MKTKKHNTKHRTRKKRGSGSRNNSRKNLYNTLIKELKSVPKQPSTFTLRAMPSSERNRSKKQHPIPNNLFVNNRNSFSPRSKSVRNRHNTSMSSNNTESNNNTLKSNNNSIDCNKCKALCS